MDLFTLIKVVLSRWRVVVPIGVLTLGLAYLVQTSTPPEYQANGYLVLDAPEASGAVATSTVVDLSGLSEGIELDGSSEGRNFTVTSLGGSNYSVAAAAPTAEQAELDAGAIVDALGERVRTIQEDEEVPETGRLDVRLVEPQIVAEEQADGSFLASATIFLNDPAAATENPYPPTSYTGRLLQVSLTGDSGLARFSALTGGGVTLEVGQEARDAAPLLQIVTTGADPQLVIDGFFHARDIMVEDLVARQDRANLLPRQRTTVGVLDAPLGVVDQSPPVERATAAVIALGGLLALGVAIAMEGWQRRSGTMGSLRDLMRPDDADDDILEPESAPRSALVPPRPVRNGRSPGSAGDRPLDERLRDALSPREEDDWDRPGREPHGEGSATRDVPAART